MRGGPCPAAARVEPLESRVLLDAVPVAAGAPFVVDTSGAALSPDVAADADGNYVVVWQDSGHPGPVSSIYARLFAADGTPRGEEFKVDQGPNPGCCPRVAMDAGGDFVVAWDVNTGFSDVYARRYGADGTPRGNQFLVNDSTTQSDSLGGVAMDGDGDFLITWTGAYDPGGAASDVYARRYTADGQRGLRFRVNATAAGYQDYSSVAMDPAGHAVIAWLDSDGRRSQLVARRYNERGLAQGAPFKVSTTAPSNVDWPAVGMSDAGDFAIAWSGFAPGRDGSYVRGFDAAGAPRGEEILAIAGPQGDRFQSTGLSVDAAGRFVVTGREPEGRLAARFFEAGAVPRGPSTAFVPASESAVSNGVVLRRAGDRLVFVNAARLSPGGSLDVYARRFTVEEVAPAARVVGRHVFYRHNPNGSAGEGPLPADDAAIATDKHALLPGETPSFANVTSYDKGINGIMVDVAGLRPDSVVSPVDLGVGGANPPVYSGLRRGAGVGGSDRYTLLWNDAGYAPGTGNNAVADGWLTVTAKASNLGLERDDVFSFGNLVGETGDGTGANGWRVSALDLSSVKRALNSDAPITSATDFNRDGRTNALDLAIVKRNLNLVLPPPTGPAAGATASPRLLRAADEILQEARAPGDVR